jgi:hypothetical protein
MTEAISQDPAFQEMAKEMQESMLAGGMGGLNLGAGGGAAAEGEDAGPAAPGPAGMPDFSGMMGGMAGLMGGGMPGGMPGAGGMPGVDPSRYMEAMQRVMANPEFMSAAESLGRNLMSQSLDPESAAMMELLSVPANQEALRARLEGLKGDPELGGVMREIEENGQEALMKYMNDPEIMSKVGRKFQEAMADPEFRAQLAPAAGTGALGAGAEGEEEETVITAASAGDVARLRELLEAGADADVRDEERRTALHFASGYGELEVMEVLLVAGADADAKDENENTALHYAAGYGNVAAAEVLLKQ